MDSENITLLLKDWKIILLLTTIIALYYYFTATYDFFKKKGVPYMKPVILLGNMGPRLLRKKSEHEHHNDIYKYFKGQRYGGVFDGRNPILFVFDPDLIKSVTIHDFDHFRDRLVTTSPGPRYLNRPVHLLKGSEWKDVRSTLSPVFTSARLKNMISLINPLCKHVIQYFEHNDKKEVDSKSAMERYSLGVIGACAFGIKCDVLKEENNHFVKMVEQFDLAGYKRLATLFIFTVMPKLIKLLNIPLVNVKAADQLMRILQASKVERRLADSRQNDFLQILVDVAKKEKADNDNNMQKCIMDEDTIDAQCLLFLLAGYETTSALLSFAIHMLAINPEIQAKLRDQIVKVTEGKEITYEMINDLDYLEGVLLETLRLYPPAAKVTRVVTKPYTFPGSNVQLDVGDVVGIPIYGIHMDPDHYPEPHEFRPERFMGEEKKARPSHLFLAFGAGPRNCIGLRFALLSAKLTIVHLLKNFKFTKCSKTEDTISFDKQFMNMKPKSGLWVRVDTL